MPSTEATSDLMFNAKSAEIVSLLRERPQPTAPGARPNTVSAERSLARATRLLSHLLKQSPPPSHATFDTALTLFMTRTLHYRCVPQCCNASSVRLAQIKAKSHALRFIGQHRPMLLARFSAVDMQDWLAPPSTIIAMATAEALSRSPAAAVQHQHAMSTGLVTHPRWQVREFLLRAVAHATWHAPSAALVSSVRSAIRSGDPSIMPFRQRQALVSLHAA